MMKALGEIFVFAAGEQLESLEISDYLKLWRLGMIGGSISCKFPKAHLFWDDYFF